MIQEEIRISKNWLERLRDDSVNSRILNYLAIFYIFTLTISYKVDGAIIWIIILIFLLNENIGIKIKNAFQNRFVQACLLHFLIYIIWMVGSENIDTAQYLLKYNKPLLYSLIFVAFIKKEFVDKFVIAFILGMLINVVWSYLIFFGFLTQPSFANQSGYLPILNKVDHSFFILLILGYSLYRLLVLNDPFKYKVLFLTLFAFESINIFLSSSRTSMIIYFIMVITTLIYIYRTNIIKIISLFVLLSSFFISSVYFLLPSVKENITNEFIGFQSSLTENNYNSSSGSRVGMAKYAILVIQDNFLFGVGTGDHIPETLKKIKSSVDYGDGSRYQEITRVFGAGYSAKLHNNHLQVFVQFGIFGFVSLMLIFGSILIAKFIKDEYRFLSFLIIILSIIAMGTGYGFGENNFGKFFIFILSAMIVQNVGNKKSKY